jgi:zinc resistance-associated protein
MRAIATLAAASALALAGAVAFAQTTPSAPPAMQGRGIDPAPNAAPSGPQQRLRWRNTLRDALTDARIAGIQAGLKLNADQQRLWASVEQAIRAQAAERAERIEQRLDRLAERRTRGARQGERLDLMQRLEQRAERIDERARQVRRRAETLRSLVAAMRPFWTSLDEDQKRLLPRLMRSGNDRRAWRRWDHHHGHHGGMDHGGGSGR